MKLTSKEEIPVSNLEQKNVVTNIGISIVIINLQCLILLFQNSRTGS
jgi:hypothetical protein